MKMLQSPNSGSAWPAPVFHNPDLAKLVREKYARADIEQIRRALVDNGTVALHIYYEGGVSAVTPMVSLLSLDATAAKLASFKGDQLAIAKYLQELQDRINRSLESGIDGELQLEWDRDAILVALTLLSISVDPRLGAGLNLDTNAWKRVLVSVMQHHYQNQDDALRVIRGQDSGLDMSKGFNIRWNPVSKADIVGKKWGHRQNDALGFDQWFLFYAINRGLITWDDKALQPAAHVFTCLLHAFWWMVHVWEDHDLGAWEDKKALHASSLIVAAVSLWEQLTFMRKHGPMTYNFGGKKYDVHENGVKELYDRCAAKLAEILPNEFLQSENGDQRSVDSALVNGLMLAQLSQCPVVSDAMTLLVVATIERDLMGEHGISRYRKDQWDGRDNRHDFGDGQEAKWCHVSPMISIILGCMYRRTGNQQFLLHQTYHFNRGLAAVDADWDVPECYIIDRLTRNWVADKNKPLAWAQAMLLLSVQSMDASMAYQAARAGL
jgi:hypothetical protein